MPSELDKYRIQRLKAIDGILSSSMKALTLNELIEKVKEKETDVKIDRFIIDRDLDLLIKMGYCERKKDSMEDPKNHQTRKVFKYKYKNRQNTLFQVNMTQEEKDFLSEALAMLGLKGIEGMKFFRSLNLKKSGKSKLIISFTKNPIENKVNKWFPDIYDAIRFKDVIKIGVKDRQPPFNPVTHTVHPWYLREYNRRWYLFGFDEEEQGVRRYTLDRISKFEIVEEIKYRRADVKMEEIVYDIVGVSIEEGEVLDILFWVSDVSADYVDKKHIHHTQKPVSHEEAEKIAGHPLSYEGGKYFTVRCKENYELRREMLSFGPALVVLTPQHLRVTLKQQLIEMIRMYD